MKKEILLILMLVLAISTANCQNMSQSIEIHYLEKTYFPGKFDKMSQSEIKTLKKYYKTEEGRNHLKELEESFLKGKSGIQKNMAIRNCKRWINNFLNNNKTNKEKLIW